MELFASIKQINDSQRQSSRRRFLVGAMGAVGSYFGYRWWRDRARPVAQRETSYITPIDDFYNISIDPGFVAEVKPEQWRLELFGLDGFKAALSYAELLKLERRRVFKTFMCVGNEVGGPSIGNAEWTATPLAPIIEKALGTTSAQEKNLRVVFYAFDGFYSSVPLAVALHEQSFIAYEMNGVRLPNKHGYPARVLLPNVYGMKQPRWLSKIEITRSGETGYWEKRGWCDECPVKMTARVDAAVSQTDGGWLVTGTAYCGGQPVGQVELSDDEGKTWQAAKLTSTRLPNAWATWEWIWRPVPKTEKLERILTARVVDASGSKQIESYSGSFPSGATGLHRVIVKV
jgi:DMSO/TMAO reductase YedYZ molybdopterin-dependent catalytic subunit